MNKKNMLLIASFAISAMQTTLSVEPEQSPKGWDTLCKTYATSLISGGLIGTITGLLSIQAITKSMHYLSLDKVSAPEGMQAIAKSMHCLNPDKIITPEIIFGIIIPNIILITEYRLRSFLIDDINQTFEENTIKHKKNIIRDTAWIASWIAFLSCVNFE